MAGKETRLQKIVRLTAKRFPSFGGGKISAGNPISHALKNAPPTFAAGVDIEQVVSFVLAKRNAIERARRQNISDDARDHANTAGYLNPLSSKALCKITQLKDREIRQRLKDNVYPFSRLSKKTREMLLHLPGSWVRGGASWRMILLIFQKRRTGDERRVV